MVLKRVPDSYVALDVDTTLCEIAIQRDAYIFSQNLASDEGYAEQASQNKNLHVVLFTHITNWDLPVYQAFCFMDDD